MTKINKLAQEQKYLRKPEYYFRARDAWEDIIRHFTDINRSIKFLIPAYIGYSSNEGSGIFDPIKNQKSNYGFYNFRKDLTIDFLDLKQKVNENPSCVVLLVHYFGFPDRNYKAICDYLYENNIPFVEDCAHSLFSDYIGGACGRRGAFSFYSLHKMLPLETGGMLISNHNLKIKSGEQYSYSIFDFDFKSIYDIRRENYQILLNLLEGLNGITILYPTLPEGVCPQTFPILLEKNRDQVYFEMNKNGYGVVSLYHTMIDQLSDSKSPDAFFLAQHITNLPVHQDVETGYYEIMIKLLKNYL